MPRYPNPIDGKIIHGLRECTGGMEKFTEGFMDSDDFHGGQIKDRVVFGSEVGTLGLCGAFCFCSHYLLGLRLFELLVSRTPYCLPHFTLCLFQNCL